MPQLCQHARVSRLQAPLLCGCQLGRDREVGQVLEGLADLLQALLELSGGGRDDQVLGGTRPQHIQRRLQQHATVGLVSDAVAGDQGQRLAMLEAVALDGAEQQILVLARHRTQRLRESRSDRPLRQAPLGLGREVFSDRDASLDPLGLSVEQARDPGGCEAVLLQQRADHARLVEGRQGAWRCVGEEQQAFVLLGTARALQDHWDPLSALLSPEVEALEAVDHLPAPILGGHDADRKGRQLVGRLQGRPRPKRRVAGAQGLNRQLRDGVGGLCFVRRTTPLLSHGHTDLLWRVVRRSCWPGAPSGQLRTKPSGIPRRATCVGRSTRRVRP